MKACPWWSSLAQGGECDVVVGARASWVGVGGVNHRAAACSRRLVFTFSRCFPLVSCLASLSTLFAPRALALSPLVVLSVSPVRCVPIPLCPVLLFSVYHPSLQSRLLFPVVSRMPASRHSYFPPTVHSIAAGPIAIALRFAAPPRAVPLSIYAAVVGFLHRVRLSLYPPGFGFECVLLSPVTASFSARSSPDNVGGASACVASPAHVSPT